MGNDHSKTNVHTAQQTAKILVPAHTPRTEQQSQAPFDPRSPLAGRTPIGTPVSTPHVELEESRTVQDSTLDPRSPLLPHQGTRTPVETNVTSALPVVEVKITAPTQAVCNDSPRTQPNLNKLTTTPKNPSVKRVIAFNNVTNSPLVH